MRKLPKPQELFVDRLNTLINNLFIDNINWRNGYYYNLSKTELEKEIKQNAKYILEEIDNTRHLVDDNREEVEIKDRDTRQPSHSKMWSDW